MPIRPLLLLAALTPAALLADTGLELDADHDGVVTSDEHVAVSRLMFEAMDADTDGVVTAGEMTAAHEKVTGKPAQPGEKTSAEKIAVIDTDKDGALTMQEHADGAARMFDKMDADGDDKLSAEELEKGHREMLRSE